MLLQIVVVLPNPYGKLDTWNFLWGFLLVFFLMSSYFLFFPFFSIFAIPATGISTSTFINVTLVRKVIRKYLRRLQSAKRESIIRNGNVAHNTSRYCSWRRWGEVGEVHHICNFEHRYFAWKHDHFEIFHESFACRRCKYYLCANLYCSSNIILF